MSKKNGRELAILEQPPAQSLTVGKAFSLTPQNLEQAMSLAKMIADSDLAPKDFRGKAGNCLIAMQMGMEVGLAPMQAIQSIAVINGRPTLWGDAALALVLAAPICEYVKESWDEKSQTWTCRSKRRDTKDESVYTFSLADAEKAGLTKKEGTWQSYRKRMIQMRARAFNLRDTFADVLKGLAIREEVEDYVDTTATTVEPVLMPKAKEPVPAETSVDSPMVPGEFTFFTNKLDSLSAQWPEVQKHVQAKYGITDLTKLTKAQAKEVIAIWESEPPADAESK